MFKNTKMLSFLMIAFVLGMTFFQACNEQKADVKEVKKEENKNVTSPPTSSGSHVLDPYEISIEGPTAMFGRSLVEDGPWQEDFDSTISVYAACGDAGRGNDYMKKRSEWDNYKFSFDETRQAYVLTQKVSGQKPLMFNLVQVHTSKNGATRLSYLSLAPYVDTKYVYDNRAGDNGRIVFSGRDYQPETLSGKEIPLAYDENGKPWPNLEEVAPTAAGNKTKR